MAIEIAYSVTNLLYTFVITLIVTSVLLKWYRERNYPPGPIGIPFLGYGIFLGRKPNEKLKSLSRKYGDILSFTFGPNLYVCVNDYFVAKDLLTNPKLLYRPEQFSNFMPGRGGIVGMNGEEWQEQRRFTFYTMRNLGLGKGLWETLIQEAVVDFTEELKSFKGQPTNLEDVLGFFQASNNISLLLGRHLDKEKDAENIKIIHESTREFMKYFGQVSVNVSLPWLRKFVEIFHIAGYDKFFGLLKQFEAIFRIEIDQRLQSPESLTKDDFIGCFAREMAKRKTETDHTFTYENLLGNLLIIFIASNDSTMASISFLLLYMAALPEIQKKVHEEIDSVVGRDGVINFDNKAKFPYCMATMYEMMRIVSIAPLNPPRLVMEDMTISGYSVPKGSYILVNLWSIMRDPRYFEDPLEFKPERFFVENDKVNKTVDGFFPFSVGKRNCPGEGVALMTVFLYFVLLMQKFKVTAPPGKTVDLEPIFGGAHMPKPQEMCFLER